MNASESLIKMDDELFNHVKSLDTAVIPTDRQTGHENVLRCSGLRHYATT